MSKKQYYVYTHARPDTTDVHGVFYVGKGDEKRADNLIRQRNPHHTNIVKKYGKKYIIVRRLPCKSEQHALDLEIQMIAIFRRMGVKITNVTNGGDGVSGMVHSTETRKKMSVDRKNPSEEVRKNMSNGQKNRPPVSKETIEKLSNVWKNPEYRARQSEAQKNRPPMSAETREKIGAAHKNKKISPEHLAKLTASRIGVTPSVETRAKISIAKKGISLSAETKVRMSESRKGHAVSAETRAKISASNSNPSAETRAKRVAALTGKKATPEARAKMSESGKNRLPMSDETRAKMSANFKGNKIRLGSTQSEETKSKISASLMGRKMSAEAIEKRQASRRKNDLLKKKAKQPESK